MLNNHGEKTTAEGTTAPERIWIDTDEVARAMRNGVGSYYVRPAPDDASNRETEYVRVDFLAQLEQGRNDALTLYNAAWLWVQQRVKHPNSGLPPAAMTLIEMLPLLSQRAINLCKEKASGYRESAEGNLARETWIDRAEVMDDFARELENLDHKGNVN